MARTALRGAHCGRLRGLLRIAGGGLAGADKGHRSHAQCRTPAVRDCRLKPHHLVPRVANVLQGPPLFALAAKRRRHSALRAFVASQDLLYLTYAASSCVLITRFAILRKTLPDILPPLLSPMDEARLSCQSLRRCRLAHAGISIHLYGAYRNVSSFPPPESQSLRAGQVFQPCWRRGHAQRQVTRTRAKSQPWEFISTSCTISACRPEPFTLASRF